MNIWPEIAEERDYLVSVRRHLHKNPELSLKEYATSAYIEEQLEAIGVSSRRVGETGILATIAGKSANGKTVLLRAEMDALPVQEETSLPYRSQSAGVMHACGHDVHVAALLGATKLLQRSRNTFDGKVLLAFQQAEEFGSGSRYFLKENVTQGVDRVFGVHVSPDFPVGTIGVVRGADAASCDYFRIRIHGRDAHISKPWLGIDALFVASLLVTRLKTLVEQIVKPPEKALVGVGKITSGTAYNIIAGEAVIEGTTRAFSHETQAALRQKVTELAQRTALENGAVAVTEFETFTSPLINDSDAFDEVTQVAEEILGKEHIVTDEEAIVGLGADDFAEYLKNAKGVYVHVGSSRPGDPATQNPLHSSRFDIDEQVLTVSAALYANYTLSVLKGKSGRP